MDRAAMVERIDVDGARAALAADGCAVIPDVLSRTEVDDVVTRLWAASEESERRGMPTRIEQLDPNDRNVRVFNLLDLDPVFVDLIDHPVAETVAAGLLGDDYIVSNFTANIARPGSRSMTIHSDQSIVAPEPWLAPWSLNIIWVLCDLRAENGATRYLPGSHRFPTMDDLPTGRVEMADHLDDYMTAFEAPAGSIVAMEGRVWHTSGANVTTDEDRPLLFGYYSRSFVRPQWNFSVGLRPAVQAGMSPLMRYRLGLDASLNTSRAGVL
ncbi:MAG: phytanoyl-CoA dioxygenase family protein [Acidimicrobiales bacterium]